MPWGSSLFPLLIVTAGGKFTGLFVYSPGPGFGKLVASITAQAGTDPFGNAYLAGDTTYTQYPSGNYIALQKSGAQEAWYSAPTEAGPWTVLLSETLTFFGTGGAAGLALFSSFGAMSGPSGTGHYTQVWLAPSGDTSGALDVTNLNNLLAGPASVIHLLPGTFYLNATIVANENQYIAGAGFGATVVNLVTTGIAAFQWKQANPAVYVSTASGGILEPGLTVVGPGGAAGVNPSDGSIGVQMADIPKLRCKIQVVDCQWGLLCSNQNFFTEQAQFEVHPQSCTNPVVFQVAASGGAGRTGSFDRTEVTVYHNDFLNGSHGLGGVQLLNGAQFSGGKIKQYGNFNTPGGGAGQAGVYALYISGTFGGVQSSLSGTELVHAVESSATSNQPGTIFIGSANSEFVNAWGSLVYGNGMGTFTPGVRGSWQFSGPVNGTVTGTIPPSLSFYGSTLFTVTANGQTIPVVGSVSRLAAAGAFTGLILTVGTWDGQVVEIANQSASAQTFAVAATSHVSSSISATPAIGAGGGMRLVWDSATSLWYVTGTG